MKKKSLILVLFFGLSINIFAQTTGDQSQILQKCLDLTVLQQYYPTNPNNTFKPLVILQHGISFPTNIAASHSSNPLVFKSKADISLSNESAYFLFWEFNYLGNLANVEFTYSYDYNTSVPKAQKVSLKLQKSGNVWSITNTNIEGITL